MASGLQLHLSLSSDSANSHRFSFALFTILSFTDHTSILASSWLCEFLPIKIAVSAKTNLLEKTFLHIFQGPRWVGFWKKCQNRVRLPL